MPGDDIDDQHWPMTRRSKLVRLGQGTPLLGRLGRAMFARFTSCLLVVPHPLADGGLIWRGAVSGTVLAIVPRSMTAHAYGWRIAIARRVSLGVFMSAKRDDVAGVGGADVVRPGGHDRPAPLQHAGGARH